MPLWLHFKIILVSFWLHVRSSGSIGFHFCFEGHSFGSLLNHSGCFWHPSGTSRSRPCAPRPPKATLDLIFIYFVLILDGLLANFHKCIMIWDGDWIRFWNPGSAAAAARPLKYFEVVAPGKNNIKQNCLNRGWGGQTFKMFKSVAWSWIGCSKYTIVFLDCNFTGVHVEAKISFTGIMCVEFSSGNSEVESMFCFVATTGTDLGP